LPSLLLTGVCLLLPAARLKAAQEERPIDVDTTVRVTLGKTSGTLGSTAVVPIYFTPPTKAEIATLKLQVTFVSVNLKFEKLEPGPVAEMENVKLSAEVKPGQNESGVETSTVTVSASSQEPGKQGIPSGLLGYLTLRISENGKPAQIALKASAEAAAVGSTERLGDVRAFGTELGVIAPGQPLQVVCFFFSH
jgi:hypothetical protein